MARGAFENRNQISIGVVFVFLVFFWLREPSCVLDLAESSRTVPSGPPEPSPSRAIFICSLSKILCFCTWEQKHKTCDGRAGARACKLVQP